MFDINFEEDILSKALVDGEYLRRSARLLDVHHFNSPQHSWVWKTTRDIFDRYREGATPRLMITKARDDYPDDDDREVVVELLKKLYKRKAKAPKATLEELEKFVRAVNAQLALEEAARNLEKGKIEKVYEGLRHLTKSDVRAREYTHGRWIEDFDKRQAERKYRKEHPEEFTRIPTGFKRLDRVIDGLELGEFGLVMSTTGQGKSIMLTNLCYNAVRLQFPSVYFTLEMPERQIAQRQDARWLRIPYDKFKHYDFTRRELASIKKRLAKVRKRWSNMLHIIEMPLRRANIESIRGALDDLKVKYDFKPKAIFVDSADHLKGVGRFESYRLEQSEVYWDCASLAMEGYALWTSTHAGKEWAKKIAEAEATGESYDKARIADVVVTLNTPEKKTRRTKISSDDDDEAPPPKTTPPTKGKYVELYLAKYRDGESKINIPLDAEFKRMYMRELEETDD